ncbi:fibronectin type III domain-containing protein [Patescibacteria group bacterium]|nr:fibronectin type III domain-containing protein [Patescibacteria group bacterium]
MKKRFITIIILLNIVVTLTIPQNSQADQTDLLMIQSLRISPSDNSAEIIWTTNYPTTGHFDFGLTNALGSWLDDNTFNTYHETVLGGLIPEQTYYFKITAAASDGRIVISDIYNFEAAEENDTKAPIVSNVHTSFITGNTATFVWQTNEPADSCVYYGSSIENLNKTKCNGSKVTVHDLTATGLDNNRFYYYKISSKDSSGNIQYSVYYNFMTNFNDDEDIPDLIIYEISPFNSFYAQDSASVIINLKANRPVEGDIRYGAKSGSYNKKVYLDKPRNVEQEKILDDLEFNTTYYYKVYLKDILNKTLTTPEFSFHTLPQNLLTLSPNLTLPTQEFFNINDVGQDFDLDGLTNAQEQQYNTDPIKADTDGDGYIDGIEVSHGYNPNGPGKIPILPQENFAYGQSRLKSLAEEASKANQLKTELEEMFGGLIPVAENNWPTLVNAYIYGSYPALAIYKSIVWGGKTVHPSIPWGIWQNSSDYLEYINK